MNSEWVSPSNVHGGRYKNIRRPWTDTRTKQNGNRVDSMCGGFLVGRRGAAIHSALTLMFINSDKMWTDTFGVLFEGKRHTDGKKCTLAHSTNAEQILASVYMANTHRHTHIARREKHALRRVTNRKPTELYSHTLGTVVPSLRTLWAVLPSPPLVCSYWS